MKDARNFAGFALLVYCIVCFTVGCRNAPREENELYQPYLNRAKGSTSSINPGVLDTISLLFKEHEPGLKDKARYYQLKSVYYKNKGDFETSLQVLDSLKRLLEENQSVSFYREMYTATLFSMAGDYSELRLYDDAIDLLLTANKFTGDNVSNGCASVGYNAQVAEMLLAQDRQKMGISYLRNTYQAAQACPDTSFDRFYHSYSSLYKISSAYLRLRANDSAQHYADTAMQYVLVNASRFPGKKDYIRLCKAMINGNLAFLKFKSQKYKEAEGLLIPAINATEKIYPRYVVYLKLDLADVYLRSGKASQAKEILDALYNDMQASPKDYHIVQRKILAEDFQDYYSLTGDHEKALYFGRQVIALEDSLRLTRRNEVKRDLGLELKSKAQTSANELLQVKYERKNFQLAAAVLAGVVVLLIAVFIWVHSKRMSKNAKLLKQLNHEIYLKNIDIQEAYTSLEDSHFANTRLMLTVAHDLKSLVTGITNLAQRLHGKAAPHLKEDLNYIITASADATTLIEDLSHKDVEKEDNEINEISRLIRYCVEIMRPKAARKGQQIVLREEPVFAAISKEQVWRIVTNILNNAIKFSPEGGSIEVTLEKKEHNLLLSVKDNGIGIPGKMLKNPFDFKGFSQRKGTAGEPSYGFGLKITKEIIDTHNGKLWVESTEGEGSTFFIQLPAIEE